MTEKNFDALKKDIETDKPEKKFPLAIVTLLGVLILFGFLFDVDVTVKRRAALNGIIAGGSENAPRVSASREENVLEERVLPQNGVTLPVKLGDIGVKLAATGVIDGEKFKALYQGQSTASQEANKIISETNSENIIITRENAPVLLNVFWALGLGNKNAILENGPMADPRYGGTANFASTGGWTIASGDAMNHYSRHPFVILSPEQQSAVERVAKNIYRPCCNNPTHFPDCNHGMAMLGLLELMAREGVSEQEMYKTALRVNSYWFPENYMTIAKYLESKGVAWEKADAKEILGANYSSGSGYQRVLAETQPVERKGGGSCGV